MKREELKYFDCNEDSYDSCGFKFEPMEVYDKEEADSVMDAMEERIKELEDELQVSCRCTEDARARIKELEDKVEKLDFFWDGCGLAKRGFKNTIGVANYIADLEDRIKELEAKFANELDTLYKTWEDKCKELEASQPKWISVKDRLPPKDKWILTYGENLCDVAIYTKKFGASHCRFTTNPYWSGGEVDGVTHWMLLPQPPKSED